MTVATFARGYYVTARPYLCFASGATGLVGIALAPSLGTARSLVAGAVFFVAYGLGQALTDVTQLDTDSISAPYRPMVQGLLRPRDVLVVSLLGLAACALVLVALNPVIAIFAGLPVVGLATYTPMKRRYWAGPVWNAWIVAMLPFLAALTGGRPARAVLADTWSAMATTFFAYLTFVLLGYLKDVEADRRTGYVTLPVRFGRKWTVAVSFACALCALVASVPPPPTALAAGELFWSFGAVMLVVAHVRAWSVTTDAGAHPAITMGLRGYVALHLSEALVERPGLLLVAVATLVAFEIALARRPSKEQV
jgi:4-hydroxybenzoate polyprenyltransferase